MRLESPQERYEGIFQTPGACQVKPSNMTVLIIDDDAEDAMLLSDAINDIAPTFKCMISHNYNSTKAILDEEPAPDFIFLDAMMYPVGGKETLVFLTQMEKLTDSMIIINSGMLSQTQIDEFMFLGADRILQKPPDYRSLIFSITNILLPG